MDIFSKIRIQQYMKILIYHDKSKQFHHTNRENNHTHISINAEESFDKIGMSLIIKTLSKLEIKKGLP